MSHDAGVKSGLSASDWLAVVSLLVGIIQIVVPLSWYVRIILIVVAVVVMFYAAARHRGRLFFSLCFAGVVSLGLISAAWSPVTVDFYHSFPSLEAFLTGVGITPLRLMALGTLLSIVGLSMFMVGATWSVCKTQILFAPVADAASAVNVAFQGPNASAPELPPNEKSRLAETLFNLSQLVSKELDPIAVQSKAVDDVLSRLSFMIMRRGLQDADLKPLLEAVDEILKRISMATAALDRFRAEHAYDARLLNAVLQTQPPLDEVGRVIARSKTIFELVPKHGPAGSGQVFQGPKGDIHQVALNLSTWISEFQSRVQAKRDEIIHGSTVV